MDVKHNAWFNCLLALFSCFCLNTELALGDGISTNQSLVGYQTIVSPEGNFVLGFFRPGNSSKSYIGIWYNKLSEQTPVWVANRETPVSDSSSSELKIDGGNLVLLNESSHQIWSTNLTPTNSSSVEAVLGDDGNLVLRDGSNTSQPLWQSFDHPTDTFLPGSKMGLNKKTGEITRLISWKSSADPSPGLFSLGLDPNGTSQFSTLWNLTDRIWASGLWNEQTKIFENIPEMTLNYIYNCSYVDNENESYFTYSLYNTSYVSRLTMDWNGQIENTVWFRDSKQWLLFWSQPRNKTASGFSRKKNNKRIIVTSGVVGSVVAVVLVGLLIFLIFRRKRAINPGKAMEGSIMANGYRDVQNGTNNFLVTLEDLVGSATPLHDTQKRIKDLIDSGDFDEEDRKSIDVHSFDFDSLVAATDDFSDANKLGQGGFGPVYKGRFPGGQEIAIKRLSSVSAQGLEEFKNEVLLIAKLQHRNLVRLLGYCFKGDEKILVYEYLPNKSLDFSTFDEKRNTFLNWEVRFNIILGIARGLLYLHQDSRLRIVHRDLKTSNILLDKELNPKISDFGLAKIVEGKNNEGFTTRVVGTYGYMSPEYALDGLFSVKSDVFSFGVVVLEILSGKKNTAYFQSEDVPSLLGYAWKLWREEKPLELMDENLSQSCNAFEFLKCMNVALLCIQDVPADRPNVSNVVVMLISETETFPTPKQPAFFARGGFTTSTVNKVLLSSSRIEEEKETCLMATSERGN